MSTTPTVRILGTHGVPAAYGGFETAAENIGLYLAAHGWRVVVYCQADGEGATTYDTWRGLERVTVRERRPGWRGTSSFDLKCVRHAVREHRAGDVWLTFGYNTGVFDVVPRLRGIPNVVNMDGMESTRAPVGAGQAGDPARQREVRRVVRQRADRRPPAHRPLPAAPLRLRRVTTITYGAYG